IFGAELLSKLQWQGFDFDNLEKVQTVPAAPSENEPQWGILQLGFKAGETIGPRNLSALFSAKPQGAEKPADYLFSIAFTGVTPSEVDPAELTVGDLPEGAAPRKFEMTLFSMTRDADRFPPPAAKVASNEPFVRTGTPTPVSGEDLDRLSAVYTQQLKKP